MEKIKNENSEKIPDITVVIPAYNESEGITEVIEKIQKVIASSSLQWDILVIDDGSDDKTSEIVDSLNVPVIRHEFNKGYGAALKTGLRAVKSEWFAIIDADGTYPESELLTIADQIENSDMVVAARTGKNVNIPLIRRPAKAFIGKLASYVAEIKIPDLNSGLRVMRKKVVEKYVHLLPNGFSFTSTITLAMLVGGYRVKYIPIDYLPRKGNSKIRPIYDTLNFMSLIIRTILYFRPLKVFMPLAFLFFFLGTFTLFGSWYFLGKIMDSSATILFMTGVQMLALGLLAELIVRRSPQ
jgi:glycosyltransferase involved in cell wall biosynthesis